MNLRPGAQAIVFAATLVFLYGGCNPCGNGKLDSGEQCDDADNVGTDGCAVDCKTEGGYTCSGEPSICTVTGTAGTNCVDSTSAEFATAIQPYATLWTSLKEKATQLGFAPDGPYDGVLRCDEGNGTTQWLAHIPPAAGQNNVGAGLMVRPDIPSAPVILYYSTGNANNLDEYMVTPYLMFHSRNGGALEITDLSGDALPGGTASVAPSWPKDAMARFFRRSR
jgi:cysteine-rich repeat protein